MYIFINTASLKNRLHGNDNYIANLNGPSYYATQSFSRRLPKRIRNSHSRYFERFWIDAGTIVNEK